MHLFYERRRIPQILGLNILLCISISNSSADNLNFRKCCPNSEILTRNLTFQGLTDYQKYSCTTKDQTKSSSYSSYQEEYYWSVFKSPNDFLPFSAIPSLFSETFPPNQTWIPSCKTLKVLENGEEIWFRILEDGDIVVGLNFWVWPIWLRTLKRAGYCLDHVHSGDERQRGQVYKNTSTQFLFFCELDEYQVYKLHRLLYGISFMVSATFLLLTIAIFIISKHGLTTSIHYWLLLSYFSSMFLFYVFEGARIWTKFDGLDIHLSAFCFYHAIIAQYFTFTTSFTIFSLAVHMLWTFWNMKPLTTPNKRPKPKNIFIFIWLPWVIPVLGLVGGLIYNHFTNANATKQEMGIFEFGHARCTSPVWIVGTALYAFLFLLNGIYFMITSGVILKTIYLSTIAKKPTSIRKFASETFRLLLKISLIMGVWFGFTIYEMSFGQDTKNSLGWTWGICRITFFGLQGFWLFVAFGWTSSNYKDLRLKFESVLTILRGISVVRKNAFNTTSNDADAAVGD